MKRHVVTVSLLALWLSSPAVAQETAQEEPSSPAADSPVIESSRLGEAADWKILYAGSPGGSREKAFVEFLGEHFKVVEAMNLEKLTVETAAPYDVIVADWTSQYGNDGYGKGVNDGGALNMPKVKLPPSFSKPVIAIDYVAAKITRRTKLDWL